MNKTIRKLTIAAAAAIPAVALLAGTAGAVSQYSKVTNGDFSNGTTGWTAAVSPPAQVSNVSGRGYVANAFNGAVASKTFAYQCFPVTGGKKYELKGKIYIPANQKRQGSANLGILFYSGNDCTDHVGGAFTLPVNDIGSWKSQSVTPTAPASAKSAMVRLGVEKKAPLFGQQASDKFGAYFDDIEVLEKSIKIPNGPIIVNPTATPTPKGPIIVIPNPTATPTPKGPIIKIPIPTTTPQPPTDDLPEANPEQDPTPDPQPEQPQQPEPEQPQQPEPEQPQDEPAPVDEEPTEQDVPGPDLPAPDMDDDEPAAPGNGGGDNSNGEPTGSDAPQGNGDSGNGNGEAGNGSGTGGDTGAQVETLGTTGKSSTSKDPKNTSGPTPSAPSTGNAGSEDGLIGDTALAMGAGLGLAGLGLALVALARSRRKPQEDQR